MSSTKATNRPLIQCRTWRTIPARAVVKAGDVLEFNWLPDGWTDPMPLTGMVLGPCPDRRTWLVIVPTVTGPNGCWRVRMIRDRTMTGVPESPSGEDWWLQHAPATIEPFHEERIDASEPSRQMTLFDN